MAQAFLSDGWFEQAEKIRAEIDPEVPEAEGRPDGDVASDGGTSR